MFKWWQNGETICNFVNPLLYSHSSYSRLLPSEDQPTASESKSRWTTYVSLYQLLQFFFYVSNHRPAALWLVENHHIPFKHLIFFFFHRTSSILTTSSSCLETFVRSSSVKVLSILVLLCISPIQIQYYINSPINHNWVQTFHFNLMQVCLFCSPQSWVEQT